MTRKVAYLTFTCTHAVCRTCVLHMLNHGQMRCPLCRADIADQIPRELLDEVEPVAQAALLGPLAGFAERPRREEDEESADEIDEEATHIKIRYGAREIGFLRNDGAHRELYFEDGGIRFRVVYHNRKCFLYRSEAPDAPIALHPLTPICAALPPPPQA